MLYGKMSWDLHGTNWIYRGVREDTRREDQQGLSGRQNVRELSERCSEIKSTHQIPFCTGKQVCWRTASYDQT